MVRNAKTTRKSREKPKWNNIGIPPEVDAELVEICGIRGWNKKTAVSRMIRRELSEIRTGTLLPTTQVGADVAHIHP